MRQDTSSADRSISRRIADGKTRRSRVAGRQEMLELAQKAARAVAFDWYIGARGSENRWSPGSKRCMDGAGHVRWNVSELEEPVRPDDWPAAKLGSSVRKNRATSRPSIE